MCESIQAVARETVGYALFCAAYGFVLVASDFVSAVDAMNEVIHREAAE